MIYDISAVTAQFQQDGFAVVRGFLDKSELAELDGEIDRYIKDVLPSVPRVHVVYESGWNGPLKHFSRMELYDDFFKRFFHRPSTVELVEACLNTQVEPLTSEVFYKPARVGSPALLHQDNAYFNYLPPYGLVVWTALDEVTLQNGAIQFARGSHRLGDVPHEQTDILLFNRAIAELPDREKYPEVPALLQPGDATIHHFLTAHRSGPNQTDRNRRGYVMDFRARDAQLNDQAHSDQESYKKQVFKKSGAI